MRRLMILWLANKVYRMVLRRGTGRRRSRLLGL